jgi:hypothetical protein
MLDLSHIPNSQQDIKIFYAVSGSNSWQTWQKPRKCNYVWIMCIGGGGGGQSGLVGSGSASGGTSTGGGAGAVTRALFNASYLPDTLYMQVGTGGKGGASSTTNTPNSGQSGTRSFISLTPNTTSTNVIMGSGAAAALGGVLNTTATGETAFTTTNGVFVTLANFISTAGNAGTNLSSNVSPLTSQITCQGAGGAGGVTPTPTAFNGYSISATSISPLIQGGIGTLSLATNGGNGSSGYTYWKPFFSLGGAGGGNSDLGNGGNGGNGGIGSGGGGGGCSSANTAGVGGNGGDGLVVIISF